jgi:molybdate transport system substrate-binding protein
MRRRIRILGVALVCAALFRPVSANAESAGVKVYAAASLTRVLQAISDVGMKQGLAPCLCVHAASSTLARQIERGAPADIFISANPQWVDYLKQRGALSRQPTLIAGNRLVLIAPTGSPISFKFNQSTSLSAAIGGGWLALAEPDHVPAGIYAMAGLKKLNQWTGISGRLARAPNVRAALTLVVRKEAVAGIVYESDAVNESRVRVVDRFPRQSHPEIRYMAVTVGKTPSRRTARYLEFLTSAAVAAILSRYGFLPPS